MTKKTTDKTYRSSKPTSLSHFLTSSCVQDLMEVRGEASTTFDEASTKFSEASTKVSAVVQHKINNKQLRDKA